MSSSCMNSSLIIYFVIITLFILGVSYIFRKVWHMDSYTKILERKVMNLKKQNLELQQLLESPEDISFEDADILMQGIFNFEKQEEVQDKKHVRPVKQEEPTKCTNKIIDQDTILFNDDISTDLPVSVHNIIDLPEKDSIEIESVISEPVNGVYNRKKLSKFNLDKLKEICSSMDLPTEGTKSILIERILVQ